MTHIKKLICIFPLIVFCIIFSGCSGINSIEVKLGLKNNDFEYLNEGKVKTIIIQNNRDKGYTFVVSDKKTMSELYDILSTAKKAKTKSSLQPDYTIEMQQGTNKTIKFNYIVGIDKKDSGNFYNGDNVYLVSKNIDTNIITNFGVMNEPRNFKDVYYESILETIDKYNSTNKKKSNIGVNLNNDINGAKYILSTELEDFKTDLNKRGIELVNKDKNYDIVFNVETEGYREISYKSIIDVKNYTNSTDKKYYIVAKYISTSWDIMITPDKMPSDF